MPLLLSCAVIPSGASRFCFPPRSGGAARREGSAVSSYLSSGISSLCSSRILARSTAGSFSTNSSNRPANAHKQFSSSIIRSATCGASERLPAVAGARITASSSTSPGLHFRLLHDLRSFPVRARRRFRNDSTCGIVAAHSAFTPSALRKIHSLIQSSQIET